MSARRERLSWAQEGLWFLHRLDPGAYGGAIAFDLEGRLDRAALAGALTEIVRRHEPLRTTFCEDEQGPWQVIGDPGPVALECHSVAGNADPALECRRLEEAFRAEPLSLEHGPVFRACLVERAADDHRLVLSLHHICVDGWSLRVLEGELVALYAAQMGAGPAPPELVRSYAELAHGERTRLAASVEGGPSRLERGLAYWREQLRGFAPLSLPFDRPRPAVGGFRAGLHAFAVEGQAMTALFTRSRAAGATPFMALLAAFLVALHRFTGGDDLAVGVPVAGRDGPEQARAIGLFVNTVVVRVDLSDAPSFAAALQRVRAACLGAYAHQDVPLARVVQALQPRRRVGEGPLFQVLFGTEPPASGPLEGAGLVVRRGAELGGAPGYDLALRFVERSPERPLYLTYDAALFEPATVAALARAFEAVVRAVAAQPECSTRDVALTTAAERQALIAAGTGPATITTEAALHELFEAQVDRTPDAIAVRQAGREIRYRDLDAAANRIAHRLRAAGVREEDAVAVWMERGEGAIAALLGIFKHGGVAVPLDARSPLERAKWILEDSAARVLLTTSGAAIPLAAGVVPHIFVDQLAAEAAARPPRLDSRDRAASILYTSGSTGRPRGVVTLHRGAINRLRWEWRVEPFASDEVVGHKTALAFCDSVAEIFGPLLQGVPVAIVGDDAARDPRALVGVLTRERVTRVTLVPSLLRAVLDAHDDLGRRLPCLRLWTVSGESLSPDLARRFFAAVPGARLRNLYGCTEASADSTWQEVEPPAPGDVRVPIGRPLDGTEVQVLDVCGHVAPIGFPGELFVAGVGLARGYHGHPEWTAQRFVPDPGSSGARRYRTGDRARWRSDGALELLGRVDAQLEIRGVRVEPAEVESALRRHPAVVDAAVAASPSTAGPAEPLLVAYVVLHHGGDGEPAALRTFLRAALPEPMIPQRFVRLEALPRTPSGKVDYPALPPPTPLTTTGQPRDPLEVQLLGLWRDVLGRPTLGVGDDFFASGGHSLLAVELFQRMERALGRRLPLGLVVEAPTVAALAERLREVSERAPWPALVAFRTGGTRPPLVCLHGIGGGALGYRALALKLDPDQPVYGVQIDDVPTRNLEERAARYLRELRAVIPAGPCVLAGLSYGGVLAFEMARQWSAAGQVVPLVVLFDAYAPGYPRFLPLWPRLRAHAVNLARLPRDQRHAYLAPRFEAIPRHARRLARRTAAAVGLHRGLQDRVENPLLAELRAYRPQPWHGGRVVLFRAREQPVGCLPDANNGWLRLAAGGLETHEVAGGHGSLVEEPHLATWAPTLATGLRDLDAFLRSSRPVLSPS